MGGGFIPNLHGNGFSEKPKALRSVRQPPSCQPHVITSPSSASTSSCSVSPLLYFLSDVCVKVQRLTRHTAWEPETCTTAHTVNKYCKGVKSYISLYFFLVFFFFLMLCVSSFGSKQQKKNQEVFTHCQENILCLIWIMFWFLSGLSFLFMAFFYVFVTWMQMVNQKIKTWSQNRKVRGEKTKLFALGIFLVAIGYPLKLFVFFPAVILDFDFFLVAYLKIIPFFCHSENASGRSYLTFLRTGRWFDLS